MSILARLVAVIVLAASAILPASAQEVLKIGAVGTLSGAGTAWGLAVQRGIQMAIDEVNDAGGLKVGDKVYKPTLVMFDDLNSAAGGRAAGDRLISLEKVKFIIGMTATSAALAVVPVANQHKVIVMSGGFGRAILENDFKASHNFRMYNSNIEFGDAMVGWLKKNRPELKTVGLIAPNDAVGQITLPPLEASYKAQGYTTRVEMFDRGMKEFTPLLTRLMAQGIDIIDLNGNSPGDAGLLVKQARQIGFKGLIWQVGGPSVAEIVSVAGPLAEGFLSYEVFIFDDPAGQKFHAKYQQKWPGIMNAQTPIWYNAARLMLEGIKRAGTTTDTDAVRDAIEKLESFHTGVFGETQWGGMKRYGVNHQLLLPFWIVEIKNGKSVIRATLRSSE